MPSNTTLSDGGGRGQAFDGMSCSAECSSRGAKKLARAVVMLVQAIVPEHARATYPRVGVNRVGQVHVIAATAAGYAAAAAIYILSVAKAWAVISMKSGMNFQLLCDLIDPASAKALREGTSRASDTQRGTRCCACLGGRMRQSASCSSYQKLFEPFGCDEGGSSTRIGVHLVACREVRCPAFVGKGRCSRALPFSCRSCDQTPQLC